ncbi:unnamed protein product [Closterium sp. Naga37s-1]|nr:unnamed protein product [Closterium sp. Naga37s-1]
MPRGSLDNALLDSESCARGGAYYCSVDSPLACLLVYEFMPRGSLDNALLDSESCARGRCTAVLLPCTHSPSSPAPLLPPPGASGELFFSWNMRLKVAVQVAEALAYLHGANLIHRDLKAANVLLSPVSSPGRMGEGGGVQEYDAKLTDFGMVRVGPERQLQSIVSTRVMGTRGYTDPSYMETGHLEARSNICSFGHLGAKSDVYSFGVLLLELVTGRRVVDEGEKMNDEAEAAAEAAALEVGGSGLVEGGDTVVNGGLATLARHCVADNRSVRPDIGIVPDKLRLLVKVCESDELEAAAQAAALEAGGSGSDEGGDMEVNGGGGGSSTAVAPPIVKIGG